MGSPRKTEKVTQRPFTKTIVTFDLERVRTSDLAQNEAKDQGYKAGRSEHTSSCKCDCPIKCVSSGSKKLTPAAELAFWCRVSFLKVPTHTCCNF